MTWLTQILHLFTPVTPKPIHKNPGSYPVNPKRFIKRGKHG